MMDENKSRMSCLYIFKNGTRGPSRRWSQLDSLIDPYTNGKAPIDHRLHIPDVKKPPVQRFGFESRKERLPGHVHGLIMGRLPQL